jgi:hypothetical protein
MRFNDVDLDGGVTSSVRGVIALLPWSADAFEAPVGPDIFVPVEIGTGSVKVESAKRCLNSLDTAIPVSCSLETDNRHGLRLGQLGKTMTDTRKPAVAGDVARSPRAVADDSHRVTYRVSELAVPSSPPEVRHGRRLHQPLRAYLCATMMVAGLTKPCRPFYNLIKIV